MTEVELVERFRPLVLRIARTYARMQCYRVYVGVEDLAAAGYLALIRAWRGRDPTIPFFPYAEKAIAREVRAELGRWSPYFLEYGRAHRRSGWESRRLARELEALEALRFAVGDVYTLTAPSRQEDRVAVREFGARVLRRLTSISPRRTREWVTAYIWEGRSMPEIAAGAGVSYQRVQQVVSEHLDGDLHVARRTLESV